MTRALGILLLALAPLVAPPPASAQTLLSAADARAVRKVVEAQLDAFRHDDAPRAFSYAAAGIRKSIGTPENFMTMVRRSYAVVYRPSSVSFDEPLLDGGEVFQPARMTDADGRVWFALYPMLREADGTWRINGCQVALAGQEI